MTVTPGTMFDRWRVVRHLGGGGQGDVYLAFDFRAVDIGSAAVSLGRSAHAAAQAPNTGGDAWALGADLSAAMRAFSRFNAEAEGFGALKVLHPSADGTPDARQLQRMKTEVSAYRSVTHSTERFRTLHSKN
jgi:hypothetical protein